MKLSETLQKALPFGYLYLVMLGLLKESVFYNQVGINALKYSSIMDILISPIADLTSHPLILMGFVVFSLSIFFFTFILSKNYKKAWMKKLWSQIDTLTEEEVQMQFGKMFFGLFAIGLLSFFWGIGVGNGEKVASRIANNNLEYSYAITFMTNETKEVYLIGNNSLNYFYVEKNSRHVSISPASAIKAVEILKNKQLGQ